MFWILSASVKDMPDPAGPLPEPTSEQIGDFYVRLGMTFAAWQFVEASLVYIYGAAVRSKSHNVVAASFHVPTSFRVRLDMTNAAMLQASIDDELSEEWQKLFERCVKKSKSRNSLAHSVVLFDPKRPVNRQLFLAENLGNPAKVVIPFDQKGVITQSELDSMRDSFEALHHDLMMFQLRLLRTETPP